MTEVDRMAVIERTWIAYAPTAGPSGARAIPEIDVAVYQRCGWTVCEVVPRDQLRGAVEALDALRDEREKQIRGTIPPSGFFARLDALLAESPTNRGQ